MNLEIHQHSESMICVKRSCGDVISRTIVSDTNAGRDTLERWILKKMVRDAATSETQ